MPEPGLPEGIDVITFVPNPLETIPPKSGIEALVDALRYLGKVMPRTELEGIVSNLDVASLALDVQGYSREHLQLSNITNNEALVRMHLTQTVDYCIREGLLDSPVMAAGLLEGVRQQMLNGDIFFGEEIPEKLAYGVPSQPA
jgi:hypothetical protein